MLHKPSENGSVNRKFPTRQVALDNPQNNPAVSPETDRVLWGAAEISQIIHRTPRQTFHLLKSGAIKSARRCGGRWCANLGALRREFGA
jgi:hypothetical protein